MARYSGAIWYPGADKHGYSEHDDDTHLKQGCTVHSAEGYRVNMLAIIDNPALQKSWTFSVLQDGRKYQHVDTDHIQWTNGGYEANRRYWAIECEGVAGEPLTSAQLASLIEILRWLWQTHGLTIVQRQVTLWEHNEFTAVYGYPYTACPSGRIPWPTVMAGMETQEQMRLVRVVEDGRVYVLGESGKRYINDELEVDAYNQAGYEENPVLAAQVDSVPDVPVPVSEERIRTIIREELDLLPADGRHTHSE